jgi:hypothetical protein
MKVFDTLLKAGGVPDPGRIITITAGTPTVVTGQRGEVFSPLRVTTDANGAWIADLAYTAGNYYKVTYPNRTVLTIQVPAVDPPQDANHLLPGTTDQWGYWAYEIAINVPTAPDNFDAGVLAIVPATDQGVIVDTTDPRHPVVSLDVNSAPFNTVIQRATASVGNAGQPRFTGQGPPGVIEGANPGDSYLDTTTGDIYTLS